MNQKPLFYEKQKFNQKWLWTIIILANTAGIYAFYQEYQKGNFVVEFFMGYCIFTATFILLFYFMSLETTVTQEAIVVNYFPFHLKKRTYSFAEIQHLEVIKYNPIGDYGGWGVRLSKNGKAFNVRGDYGLKLYFANRKPLLIGTQKPDELKKILEPPFYNKTIMKKLYNPFEIFSERQLLLFGLLFLVIGSFLGYLFNGRFDGVLDLHFVEFADFYEVLLDNIINTLVLTIFLFLLGLFINPKTRIIDLLNNALIARIPFYILPFFNTNNYMNRITDEMMDLVANNNLEAIAVTDTIFMAIFGILALATMVWFAVLLWNGFKIATNAKGIKAIILFIAVVLLAEIASKYIITQFN